LGASEVTHVKIPLTLRVLAGRKIYANFIPTEKATVSVKPNQTVILYICCTDRELLSSRKCKFPCYDHRASEIQWRSYLPDGSPATWHPELKQNFFVLRVLDITRRDSTHVDTPAGILLGDYHPK